MDGTKFGKDKKYHSVVDANLLVTEIGGQSEWEHC